MRGLVGDRLLGRKSGCLVAISSRRRRWLVRVALLAVILLAVLAFAERDALRRTIAETIGVELKHRLIASYSLLISEPRETEDFVPIAHTDANPYGINVFLEQEVEESKIRRSLELIRDGGYTWIKQQLVWSEIETPAKGEFGVNDANWAKYDRIVRLAREYGLDVVFRVDTAPVWARPEGKKDKLETPPKDMSDYGDFVATVVSRYQGQVKYYQIWNEPNLAFEWGNEYPSPASYAWMLRTAHIRAKAVDPEAVIIMGALAPTLEMTERGLSDVYFLKALYEADVRDHFDILSVNAYGLRHGPDDARLDMDRDVNFSRPILIREVMVEHGDAGKPIWAAEVGWCALPSDFGEEPRYGTVTREQQASYTVRAYQRAQEEWPWLGGMALWHFRLINPDDVIQQHYYFNAVDEQFQPYPVYEAVKTLAKGPATLGRGFHQESHWAISRDAGWQLVREERASIGQYARADRADETLRFAFTGTSLDVVVPADPEFGSLLISVDGEALDVSAWPPDTSAASLDESHANAIWQVRVPVVRDLPDGRHEVVVRPAVEGKKVGIDGFVVDGPTARDRLVGQITVIGAYLFAGLGLAIAVGVARKRVSQKPRQEPRQDPRRQPGPKSGRQS